MQASNHARSQFALSPTHPLWQGGFRPFFQLAALAGALLPALWIAMLAGLIEIRLPLLALPLLSSVQWHAHEMFFGFGGAVLIGFLLTASKNWVGITGYQGWSLIGLSAAWLLERASMSLAAHWPPLLFWMANLAFLSAAICMLMATLIRHRARDTFAVDNRFFLISLPLLLPAKILLLHPESYAVGVDLTLAVFRLAFLLMLVRTVSAFIRGTFKLEISVSKPVDRSILSLALVLTIGPWLPDALAALLGLSLAGLLLWRLRGWHMGKALSRLDVGIMIIGYLALCLELILSALGQLGLGLASSSLSLHVFTLGTMGAIVPAMFIRIANGHTGRRIVFGPYEKSLLWLMLCALLLRTLVAPLLPGLTLAAYAGAALCWSLCFGLWLLRFAGHLWHPRIDQG